MLNHYYLLCIFFLIMLKGLDNNICTSNAGGDKSLRKRQIENLIDEKNRVQKKQQAA